MFRKTLHIALTVFFVVALVFTFNGCAKKEEPPTMKTSKPRTAQSITEKASHGESVKDQSMQKHEGTVSDEKMGKVKAGTGTSGIEKPKSMTGGDVSMKKNNEAKNQAIQQDKNTVAEEPKKKTDET